MKPLEPPGRSAFRLIACPAVLGELAEGAADDLGCDTLPARMHLSPERLKEGLHAAVAEVCAELGVAISTFYDRRAEARRLAWTGC